MNKIIKIKLMQIKHILGILLVIVLFSSCDSSKKVVYFQDLKPGISEQLIASTQITFRPEDKLSIVVSSKDPQLASLFNLPIASFRAGLASGAQNSNQEMSVYTVDSQGYIEFPVLGKIRVAGMTRSELAGYIKDRLIKENLIKDPVVTVEFMNLSVFVLGEVNKPGRINIDRDRITVLDAISMAGDLSIYGKRNPVYVLRKEGDKETAYQLDLCSAKQIYSSPAYYLQQNDVIYVEPNSVRARQSTVNGNNVRSTSFWMSLASLLTTITVLIVK